MIKAKITMMTTKSRKEFIKEFNSIDSFEKYKENKLSGNTSYFKYQLMKEGTNVYTTAKVEYGNNNYYIKQDRSIDNSMQKNSRNSQLAIKGNKIINLNMTPSRQRSLMKWINSGVPITSNEIKFIKSMFAFDKISIAQYEAINNLKEKVSRRVKI
jgi:hypothetical protein